MLLKSVIVFLLFASVLFFGADVLSQSLEAPYSFVVILFLGMVLQALVVLSIERKWGFSFAGTGGLRRTKDYDGDLADSGTIYVGNLSYKISEKEVRELFSQYGQVSSVRLMRDRKTSRFRGFGFVEMTPDDALRAIDSLAGNEFMGRKLKVNLANEKNR